MAGAAMAAVLLLGPAEAFTSGIADTDRLGYSGVITRHATLEDAQTGSNVVQTVNTGPRDLSLYQTDAYNIIMGAWWYSTAVDGDGQPRGQGWGNVNGNTGPGFMQMFESGPPFSLVNRSFAFSGFDGTHWTTFSMALSGQNSTAFTRLSAPTNTGDGGTFLSYEMNMTLTGLQGVGPIGGTVTALESDAMPTGVSGSISGIFQNTSSNEANNGFYAFHFDLSLDNWAWANRDDLVCNGFECSANGVAFYSGMYQAQAIPEPATMLALGLGAAGLAYRRRRQAAKG